MTSYSKIVGGKRVWLDTSVLSGSGSIMEKMDPLEGGLLESGFEEEASAYTGYRTFMLGEIEVTVNLMDEELFVQVGSRGRRVVCRSYDFHKVFEVIRQLWSEAQARA